MTSSVHDIPLRPLNETAFAPYGRAFRHHGQDRRLHLNGAYDAEPDAKTPSLWISRLGQAAVLPVTIDRMERHPYAPQTFIPLGQARMLVIVALGQKDGAMDPDTLAAFVTETGQGITYATNTWHSGLSVLDAPADFVVAMSLTGRDDDTLFAHLRTSVRIIDTA